MSGRRGRDTGQGSTTSAGQSPATTDIRIQSQPNLADLFRSFSRLGGNPFTAKETIIEAQAWIRSCERIFKGPKLEDDHMWLIASWQLQEEASIWWEMVTLDESADELTWSRFKVVFVQRYMPSAGISRVYKEFVDLKQGSSSFEEYLKKFNELSRFGPELVNTPLKKNEKFIRGMNKEFQERMTTHVKEYFSELIDMCYRYDTLNKHEVPEEDGNASNLNWRKKKFGGKKPRKDKGKQNIEKKR
jgi:hypothetical protein